MERWLRGGRPSSYVFGRTKSWSVPRLVHVGVNLSTVTERQAKFYFRYHNLFLNFTVQKHKQLSEVQQVYEAEDSQS